jgi:hypothetical protein
VLGLLAARCAADGDRTTTADRLEVAVEGIQRRASSAVQLTFTVIDSELTAPAGVEQRQGRMPERSRAGMMRSGVPSNMPGVIAFEWPSDPASAIDCSLLIFGRQDLQTGLQRREEAFQRIAECQVSGNWLSHGRHAFRPAPSIFSFPESEEIDQDSIALF